MAVQRQEQGGSESFLSYDADGRIYSRRDENGAIIPFHLRAPTLRLVDGLLAARPAGYEKADVVIEGKPEQTAIDGLEAVVKDN